MHYIPLLYVHQTHRLQRFAYADRLTIQPQAGIRLCRSRRRFIRLNPRRSGFSREFGLA